MWNGLGWQIFDEGRGPFWERRVTQTSQDLAMAKREGISDKDQASLG